MTMNYEHLPEPETEEDIAACEHARESVRRLLPARADIKAVRLKGESIAVFVVCPLGEEQAQILLAGLRKRFGEAFKEMFSFTTRRKFVVYLHREDLKVHA